MSDPSYKAFQQALAPPYLKDADGRAWTGAFGELKDEAVARLRAAVTASFPELSPADALPLLSSEYDLERVLQEADAAYQTRLRKAWDIYPFAGSAYSVLYALHLSGLTALVAQDNGILWALNGDASDVVATNLGGVPWYSGLPGWTFDFGTAFWSRFCVIFPSPPARWTVSARAVFDGTTSSVRVTWSRPLEDAFYLVATGVNVAPGDPIPGIGLDYFTRTLTEITVNATVPFTGWVDLIAWEPAVECPYVNPSSAELGYVRRAIRKWKPTKATCEGIYVLAEGELWDYPVGTWDDPGGVWGPPGTAVKFSP